MSLRQYLTQLQKNQQMKEIDQPVSKVYEIAGVLKHLEPQPALFHQVKESNFKVAGNLLCSKEAVANMLGIRTAQIIPTLSHAIEHHTPPEIVSTAPCQEVIIRNPDLDELPILRHFTGDGGNYISSGIMIARHPAFGQNVDFHRCMQFSKTEMAVRVVKNRDFDRFLNDLKAVDVAICIGNHPTILIAAATSVATGINELEIANALHPLQVVRGISVDVLVPAESEFVIEGTVYSEKRHAEGPFVDLTETQDIIRNEPVMEVKTITYRKDAIWHALLPGALEHKILMGMPREPTIFRKVNEVVECLDVNVNPGGCSWLHAIVQIRKQSEEDGRKAIFAAFQGHSSCKHVFVVDEDINIYDPLQVEWALATRFQADRDLIILEKAPGSSLDPSADPDQNLTTRVGFDLTRPLKTRGKSFHKVPYPKIDLEKYIR